MYKLYTSIVQGDWFLRVHLQKNSFWLIYLKNGVKRKLAFFSLTVQLRDAKLGISNFEKS